MSPFSVSYTHLDVYKRQYIDQLEDISKILDAPMIYGQTPNSAREELYAKFKTGEIKVLVVSKVANFAVDLPDASVAIQVSGTFGSRQEEAQRLSLIHIFQDYLG